MTLTTSVKAELPIGLDKSIAMYNYNVYIKIGDIE